MVRRAMIVVLGMVAGLGAAACGGGGSGEQGSGKLARAELVAKADAICTAGEKAASAIDAPSDLSDAKAAGAYFEKVAPLNEQQTDDLAALVPADDVKADWQDVIDKQHEGNELLKTLRDKAKAADASGLEDLKTFATVTGEFGAAAKKLGAKACAGEPAVAAATAAGTTTATTTAAGASTGAPGVISVDYDTPRDKAGAFAKEILRLGGTDGVAAGFTKSFALPVDVTIHVVNGVVGPSYDPATKTITLSYGFVNYTASVLKRNFPELRRRRRGVRQAARLGRRLHPHPRVRAHVHRRLRAARARPRGGRRRRRRDGLPDARGRRRRPSTRSTRRASSTPSRAASAISRRRTSSTSTHSTSSARTRSSAGSRAPASTPTATSRGAGC